MSDEVTVYSCEAFAKLPLLGHRYTNFPKHDVFVAWADHDSWCFRFDQTPSFNLFFMLDGIYACHGDYRGKSELVMRYPAVEGSTNKDQREYYKQQMLAHFAKFETPMSALKPVSDADLRAVKKRWESEDSGAWEWLNITTKYKVGDVIVAWLGVRIFPVLGV